VRYKSCQICYTSPDRLAPLDAPLVELAAAASRAASVPLPVDEGVKLPLLLCPRPGVVVYRRQVERDARLRDRRRRKRRSRY